MRNLRNKLSFILIFLFIVLFIQATFAADPLDAVFKTRPKPAPQRWEGLIGLYGSGNLQLIVLERNGRLMFSDKKGKYHILTEKGPDDFTVSDKNIVNPVVHFVRKDNKPATALTSGKVLFQRRFIGVEEGKTFKIKPQRPINQLRAEAMKIQRPMEKGNFNSPDLVEVVTLDPTIKLDIRYATSNNFMGAPFYSQPRAFLQRPAAEAVVRLNKRLKKYGYGLLVYDAYRPWYVTYMFWEATPPDQRQFVANPAGGSRHNRGAAVDLTLYDLKTGKPVTMSSTYDEFSDRAYPDFRGGASLQRWYRDALRKGMESEGFKVYECEWWHFDYQSDKPYPIMNIPFEEINRS